MPFDERFRHLPLSRSGDRAPRAKVRTPVIVKDAREREICRGQTVNLSRTGMLLEVAGKTVLKSKQIVQLTITPDGVYLFEVVQISAAIVRIVNAEGAAFIGAAFVFDLTNTDV